jgi:acyl-CoA thioesterase-1
VNGSVTGETTAGGRSRLPDALHRHRPAVVLIELGGNDGLRGLPVKTMRDNLSAMVRLSRQSGAETAVFEMLIPPNYGETYRASFQKSFATVAKQSHATLVPFFLAPLVNHPEMFQEDGIHPKAEAQAQILDAAWPVIEPMLTAAGKSPQS